jgi:hypothetical protein
MCKVLSFIFYWFGMVRWTLTIPERWQAVGMHNGGFSHRRVADHFRVNHSISVRLMQRFCSDYSVCANVASKRYITTKCTSCTERLLPRPSWYEPVVLRGLPARGRSVTFPVWQKRCISRTLMEWLTLKWSATLLWLKPQWTYFKSVCCFRYLYTILTYLWNRLLIDFYLCVYDRVCKVTRVLNKSGGA